MKSISSWFKCRLVPNASYIQTVKDYYGQFNFFFTIPEFKYDQMVSGMHYSSVVLRKFKTDDFNIDYVAANTEDS